MRVRCISNTGEHLPENYLDPARGYTQKIELPLTVGKEYVVYAIRLWQGIVWYYICDDNYSYYPIQTPAPLFEVVDNRVSKYWRFMLNPNGVLRFVFEQWLNDSCFYDKLTDQEEAEVEIFDKVKELMDAEDFDLPPLDLAVEKLRETVTV
ncbi:MULTISPECIES: hypothetical protein [unclassified Microcoleus]|uniref:hypothetical protein n=1 Tax=unclassified Microcoleus TaxID=2642155 RepID=UPI001DABCF00|nr:MULTISPECIES: hypothetical protein [unclassified Microcoleus]TAE16825.1 MAG: hypothetical protein EAZ94_00275 [Oscillatoriales cyanobacterium]MCC3411537.1 hypothetical protein [Microcoleus sp. PH2017_02_FOX_O_A]MCC3489072.1 hypothetical protein [Microcoleus sp. PH2017_16_JOR_D_A]MCC3532757.1 hypothetical protein [Microcoleus sp. PH2017_25_DOB_D_A]MCC3545157.1 hypothetical protein [Microcoleus sp. PH2017_24_DOB_U_A]